MPFTQHADGARSIAHAPRFGRRPVKHRRTLADRLSRLRPTLAALAILAIAAATLRLVIWLLTLH